MSCSVRASSRRWFEGCPLRRRPHETEAWIFADPTILPADIRPAIPGKAAQPEAINLDEPPSRLLTRLYRDKLKRRYQKLIDGVALLQRISPETVYKRCEHFRLLADDLLRLVKR